MKREHLDLLNQFICDGYSYRSYCTWEDVEFVKGWLIRENKWDGFISFLYANYSFEMNNGWEAKMFTEIDVKAESVFCRLVAEYLQKMVDKQTKN